MCDPYNHLASVAHYHTQNSFFFKCVLRNVTQRNVGNVLHDKLGTFHVSVILYFLMIKKQEQNGKNPDQARRFDEPGQGPTCLQRLIADNTSRQRIKLFGVQNLVYFLSLRFQKKYISSVHPSLRPSRYFLLDGWSDFNQIWYIQIPNTQRECKNIHLCHHPLCPSEGAKSKIYEKVILIIMFFFHNRPGSGVVLDCIDS